MPSMPTPEQIHEDMAKGYAAQRQAHWKPYCEIDSERRECQFSVRLPKPLALQMRDFMRANGLNKNQALLTIVKQFFS